MDERLANHELSERLLGLNQRLIDRLQSLSNYRVYTQSFRGTPDWVQINRFRESGESNLDVGGIEIYFGEEVEYKKEFGYEKVPLNGFNPNILGSNFYSLEGPFSSLSMTLTLMATIDQTARVLGEKLSHIARANSKARPYLRRFREVGLYHYCDTRGRIKRDPTVFHGFELYVCQYPVEGLDSVIGKFVVGEAIGEILKMREERMKDYNPRPRGGGSPC